MDPMILPISIMAVGQLATYLLGRWIERRKWLYIQNWKHRVYPVKPRPADSVHVVNPQQLERLMAKAKTTKTKKEEGIFHVTSISSEQVFPTREAAELKAQELAKAAPGVPFHILESLEEVLFDGEEEETGEQEKAPAEAEKQAEGEPKAAES